MTIDKSKVLLLLAKKAWSYEDLANVYGCTRQRIGKVINSGMVQPKTAGKIAKALGVDVTEIISDVK